MNKLDINWNKTYFMFVTNKRVKLPKTIIVNDVSVEVVQEFKLLGVTIDSKLNFMAYSSLLKKAIIKKLYSIKRLFYLCDTVKLQFFKTFIAPHFDYCSSLYMYFPKTTIQRIFSCYNYCLFKLLRINTVAVEPSSSSIFIEKLFSIKQRCFSQTYVRAT